MARVANWLQMRAGGLSLVFVLRRTSARASPSSRGLVCEFGASNRYDDDGARVLQQPGPRSLSDVIPACISGETFHLSA